MHYSTSDPEAVAALLKPWVNEPAQLRYNGKPFVSSFGGQGMDWVSVKNQVGTDLYLSPYHLPTSSPLNATGVDGLFSWSVIHIKIG